MPARHLAVAITSSLLLLVIAAPARADLSKGADQLLHGNYAAALKELEAVRGKDAPRAGVLRGRVLFRQGDRAGAEAAARALLRSPDRTAAADAAVLLAEVERASGRRAEARKRLEELTKKDPRHTRARAQLGLVLIETGEKALAEPVWQTFIDDYNDGKLDKKSAEELMYVALAARWLGSFQEASDTLQEAVSLEADLLEANIEWGWLFLEKYAAGEAEQSFDEVLKIDPNHPDAHAGMARVKLEQGYDVKSAMEHIRRALAVNPRHPRALAIRAELELDNGETAKAQATCAEVLAVDPGDLVARSVLAASRWLSDDLAGYETEKKKVFAAHPRFSRFFHIVAEFAVKEHRYKEAIALEEEALKVDPADYIAQAAMGMGWLRLGEDEKGIAILDAAFKADPFNVRAHNVLNLFEGAIAKDYVVFKNPRFKYRVKKDEKPMLERYVPRLLDKAYADMVRRYGFTPNLPTTIELFDDPDHYSVRTVGLPNLGALGVCFGQVITAISPAGGNVNWAMILWHELGHVFAIQKSSSRVPRWFTEGLSEYETIIARPEWRRENDADVWAALESGKLPSVVELNTRFTRARSMDDMMVAYHLSSLTVEYIARRFGFPAIVKGLELYGKGQHDPEVIKAITGLDVAQFDAELQKHLRERLKVYRGNFRVRLQEYDDLTALETRAAAAPDDPAAQADLAVGYAAAGEIDGKARVTAEAVLRIDPRNKKALWVLAEAALAKNDTAEARQRLNQLIAAGGDGYDARLRLGTLAARADDVAAAERELSRAKKLDPERFEPYLMLAELFAKKGREEDVIRELEGYVLIEQMDYGPLKKLVDKHGLKRSWTKVMRYGEMALHINPYDAELHAAMGTAAVELGLANDALYSFGSALLGKPPLRRPAVAHVGIARAHLIKKDTRKARESVDAALRLEPKNAAALALKKQLVTGASTAP